MKKLYIVYLPKKEKEDLKERKVLKLLSLYSAKCKYANSIISSPGYMSTRKETIKHYLMELANCLNNKQNKTNKIYYGILNGMNGKNNVNGLPDSIIQLHNCIMRNYGFIPIIINARPALEHRKVMCFFTITGKNYAAGCISNFSDAKRFLDNVLVNAVLIGSSNQSDSTYFDGISKKGEADIFMFVDEEKGPLYNSITEDKNINENGFEDTVITESVYGKGDKDPEKFLKNILEDLLLTNINRSIK